MMRVPYDERLAPIDEQIAKLIAERMQINKGTNGHPTKEQFERWCEEYKLDRNVILSVFQAMNHSRRPPRFPSDPQHLLNIIPIMRKTIVDKITYQITRMEQYEEFSLVYVEIFTSDVADTMEIRAQLMLDVAPYDEERNVQLHRGQGQINRISNTYLVSPKLPEEVEKMKFQLIPYEFPLHSRPPERILNSPVEFW